MGGLSSFIEDCVAGLRDVYFKSIGMAVLDGGVDGMAEAFEGGG